MWIKTLFSIPDGEKVTEKALRRVLISSICSILLCMTCLVSTTWAWFTASIENTDNVIKIGEPGVVVTENEKKLTSGGELLAGEHVIAIANANDPDDLQKTSTLYVTLTVGESEPQYITLNEEVKKITLETDEACTLSWEVSWLVPPSAVALVDDMIILKAEEPTEEPTTEPVTEPETELPTDPGTEPPTEPETEPPTEPETEPPTEPETEPPTDPGTEPPTEPETEPPTDPGTEPPTEPETEPPTDPVTEPTDA